MWIGKIKLDNFKSYGQAEFTFPQPEAGKNRGGPTPLNNKSHFIRGTCKTPRIQKNPLVRHKKIPEGCHYWQDVNSYKPSKPSA
jgi:hypothetical protein